MENNTNISSETKQLAKLFSTVKDVEVIPWEENGKSIGISILKDYPNKGQFIPVRNKKGENDSVSMIRVYYLKSEFAQAEDKKVPLYVQIQKANRYLFKHPIWDFDDENCPTPASLEESKMSKQPIDLNEFSRYELHLDSLQVFDLKKKKNVSPSEVVEEIYKVHLSTIKNLYLRIMMVLQKKGVEFVYPTTDFLKWVNFHLFGKRIKKPEDIMVGIYKPYAYKDLDDLTLTAEKPKILGSDFPI